MRLLLSTNYDLSHVSANSSSYGPFRWRWYHFVLLFCWLPLSIPPGVFLLLYLHVAAPILVFLAYLQLMPFAIVTGHRSEVFPSLKLAMSFLTLCVLWAVFPWSNFLAEKYREHHNLPRTYPQEVAENASSSSSPKKIRP